MSGISYGLMFWRPSRHYLQNRQRTGLECKIVKSEIERQYISKQGAKNSKDILQ